MSKHQRWIAVIPTVGAWVFVLAGCGESTGKFAGKATYKGEPVTVGSIGFHMKSKGLAQDVKLDANGRFAMEVTMPTGSYHVYYVLPTVEPPDPKKRPTPTAKMKVEVPKKYHDLETSNLSFDMKPGQNEIVIEFKD